MSLNDALKVLKRASRKISKRFLLEACVLGGPEHHKLSKLRQAVSILEINRYQLSEKLAEVGIYGDHPVFKDKMAQLNVEAGTLEADLAVRNKKVAALVAQRIAEH